MKIAIVGSAPSSEHLAPFNDPSWQIWVLGVRAGEYKRIDRIFEIHDKLESDPDKTTQPVDPRYYDYLMKFDVPVVVADTCPFNHPKAITFPYAAAKQLTQGEEYLTSSAAYMIAMAILEGAEEIGLYGVDMAVCDDEYFYQRPCMEQWIGIAKGKGIKVTIPSQSPLGRSTVTYGKGFYGDKDKGVFSEGGFLALAEQHQGKIEEIEEQINQLRQRMAVHGGCKSAYERMAKVARALAAGQDIKSLLHTAIVR